MVSGGSKAVRNEIIARFGHFSEPESGDSCLLSRSRFAVCRCGLLSNEVSGSRSGADVFESVVVRCDAGWERVATLPVVKTVRFEHFDWARALLLLGHVFTNTRPRCELLRSGLMESAGARLD